MQIDNKYTSIEKEVVRSNHTRARMHFLARITQALFITCMDGKSFYDNSILVTTARQ